MSASEAPVWSRRVVGLGLLALLPAGCDRFGTAAERRARGPAYPSAEAAADRAIHNLVAFTNPRDFAAYGYKAFPDVPLSARGAALAMFEIGLDRLRDYVHGAPVEGLLSPTGETMYFVTVRGDVRSSVRVRRDLLGYRPAALGESENAQALARYWQAGDFIVSTPGLGLIMLGRRRADRLLFVSVYDNDYVRLKVGSEQPAALVVERMVPLARQANGLPG